MEARLYLDKYFPYFENELKEEIVARSLTKSFAAGEKDNTQQNLLQLLTSLPHY